MHILVLSEMSPRKLAQAVGGFRQTYAADWERWLNTPSSDRVNMFASILRKWQATRPLKLRSTLREAEREQAKHGQAQHQAPFLDDLIQCARPHLALIEGITLTSIHSIRPPQQNAFHHLWTILTQLPVTAQASCVGISKAVLLLTNGRIGPAMDSTVKRRLRIDRIDSSSDWLAVLTEIGSDVRSFEQKWGVQISEAVPPRYRHLEVGGLCDMVLGPRESDTRPSEGI